MSEKKNKPIFKKWWFWVIIVFILGGIGAALDSGKDEVKDEPKKAVETATKPNEDKKKEEKTPKEETKKELTLEEKVTEITIDKLGKTNNIKKDRIVEIKKFNSGSNTDIISLSLNASENFTNNMTKKGMLIDSLKILEPLSKLENIEMITIIWMFPFVDQYGNEEDGKIMSMDLKQETLEKINWENFLFENLPNVADDYWEHPAVNK